MKIKNAVKYLICSYGDIRAEAKTYQFKKSEILTEIDTCPSDSAEAIVLKLLLDNAIEDKTEKVAK